MLKNLRNFPVQKGDIILGIQDYVNAASGNIALFDQFLDRKPKSLDDRFLAREAFFLNPPFSLKGIVFPNLSLQESPSVEELQREGYRLTDEDILRLLKERDVQEFEYYPTPVGVHAHMSEIIVVKKLEELSNAFDRLHKKFPHQNWEFYNKFFKEYVPFVGGLYK